MKFFGKEGVLDLLLNGNGKAAKLEQAEQRATSAHIRQCETLEAAGVQAAEMTRRSVEMAFEDDSQVDIPAVILEVEEELSCSPDNDCSECEEPLDDCPVSKKIREDSEAA